jgi:tetratricopeptide (TPR) repeat protein
MKYASGGGHEQGGIKRYISNYDEIKALKKKYLTAKRELKQVRSRAKRRELKEYIDDLKIELGWTLLDCKEYERGLALYSSVPWRTHGEMKCNGMARALTEMGYYNEARRLLERGLKRYPDSYALWVAMGALHGSLGDDFESLKCFETAIQFAPENNSAGLYNKGFILMKLGCYRDAVSILNDLIKKNPKDSRYFSDRGSCALDMGSPQEALQYYQQAMDVWQQSPDIYTGVCIYSGMCSAYFELGMIDESMEIALEGLKKFPEDDAILYQNVGATFFQKGWQREAVEVLKKGLEKFPDDEELQKFLKEIIEDVDDPDGDKNSPLLILIFLTALLHKRMQRKKQ